MKKTSQYQLNQWDAEDRILREDFNRDNANVEAGLVALNAALEAERGQRQTADTEEANARQEADTAESNARQAEDSALRQLVAAIPFVKLADITTTVDVDQVDIDISQYPLTNYKELIVIPKLDIYTPSNSSSLNVAVRLNGIAEDSSYRQESGNSKYLRLLYYNKFGGYHGELRLSEERGCIYCREERFQLSSTADSLDRDTAYAAMYPSFLTADQLQTLNLMGNYSHSSYKIKAGTQILIYGVKK